MPEIAACPVPAWTPAILASDALTDPSVLPRFTERASTGFTAPAITFREVGGALIDGERFTIASEREGLVFDSTFLLNRFRWHHGFVAGARIEIPPEWQDRPVLVAANMGHANYYHWTTQSLAAALLHRRFDPAGATPLVLPPLGGFQQQTLDLFCIANPQVVVSPGTAAVFDQAIVTNLNGPAFSPEPHPHMLAALASLPATASWQGGRRLYLSRAGASAQRRMLNEDALIAALVRHGFTIVDPGALTVAEQAAAFRAATLIVAPHGAALTNLVYAGDGAAGPHVIELFAENYLNRCFLKLAQVKRLAYTAQVHPCVSRGRHHHHSTYQVDVALVERTLDSL